MPTPRFCTRPSMSIGAAMVAIAPTFERPTVQAYAETAAPLAERWKRAETADADEVTHGLEQLRRLLGETADPIITMIRDRHAQITHAWDHEASCDQDIGDALAAFTRDIEIALHVTTSTRLAA